MKGLKLFVLFSQVLYNEGGFTYGRNEYVVHRVFEAKNRKEASIVYESYSFPDLDDELLNSLNKQGYSITKENNPHLDIGEVLALIATVNVQLIAEHLLPAISLYCETCNDLALVRKIEEKVQHISNNINYKYVLLGPRQDPAIMKFK